MEIPVVIVGAGPSGLATSACLNLYSIPNVILEREDICASLWKRRAYDRLNLHLAKEFCYLPNKPHPPTTPTYISKQNFINYIEEYVDQFNVNPIYCRSVKSATYDDAISRWRVVAKDTLSNGEEEEYICMYLVVATGENSEGFIPDIEGLDSFNGNVLHSSQFKSGRDFAGKSVLVVGCGNSGMEIALDLANHGAITSIVIRNPVHVVTREMVHLGMVLLKYVSLGLVDALTLILSRLKFGNLSKYGIIRPTEGPFYLKAITGRSPVIDVGTVAKIKAGKIQVLPALAGLRGNEAGFVNGAVHPFDAIVFATGYRSSAKKWLKDDDDLLNKEGMPATSFPNHWKGKRGLYCVGFSSRGLAGVSMDAQTIANDIRRLYSDSDNGSGSGSGSGSVSSFRRAVLKTLIVISN